MTGVYLFEKNQSYRKLDKIGHKLLPLTYPLTSTLSTVSWRYSYETRASDRIKIFPAYDDVPSSSHHRSISASLRPALLFARLGSISSGEHQLRRTTTRPVVVKYFMDSFVCETIQGSLFPCSGWLFIAPPPPFFQLRFEKFCSSFIVVADYVPGQLWSSN